MSREWSQKVYSNRQLKWEDQVKTEIGKTGINWTDVEERKIWMERDR